ncbi:MAG: LytTR family DNA-binding domain-containing protein [Flavobacteriaceae bacterium]
MKKHYLLYLFLLLTITLYAQSNLKDSVVLSIKKLQLNKALKFSQKINDPINSVFFKELNFLIKGNTLDTIHNTFSEIKNNIIVNLYNGDAVLRYSPPNDSLAFIYYKRALKLASQKQLTLYKNISYKKICNVLQKNNFSNNDFKIYLNDFEQSSIDSVDKFWVSYYKYGQHYFIEKRKDKREFNFSYGKNMPFLQASILQFKGVNAVIKKQYNNASYFYNSAIKKLESYPYSISKKAVQKIKFNLSIIEFNKGNYLAAIEKFKKIKIYKNKQIDLFRHHWISKSYDSLHQKDSADFYYLKFYKLKDDIDKKGHALAIVQNNAQERDAENNTIIAKLNKNMNTLLPILAIIVFLLSLVFLLYKKYAKKTIVLEEEKSETLQKLDELKDIVIKNHIVLKDKTKVYVADLLYIKSDDHYLKIFLSDGNSHFVRGKLSEVIKELPPNFIRSHRSYIVNRNFVKQINNTFIILTDKTEIPLSRSYKDKF